MGGAEWVPTTVGELDDFVTEMRPKLGVNGQTRQFLDFLMEAPFTPPLPAFADRELHRFAIYAGMTYAPRWARELIGYDRPPWLTRQLLNPFLALDASTSRWAFGMPACARLARERVGARVGAAG